MSEENRVVSTRTTAGPGDTTSTRSDWTGGPTNIAGGSASTNTPHRHEMIFPEDNPTSEPTITMTQAEFDRKIGERLAREKAKADKAIEDAKAEASRKRLEEEAEFKTLYEQSQARIAEIEAQAKANELTAKKQTLLIEAGYPADKLADLLGFITGDDEDAIVASVERFKNVAPPVPAYVDPAAAGGSGRRQPAQDDGYEAARERARKLLKRK